MSARLTNTQAELPERLRTIAMMPATNERMAPTRELNLSPMTPQTNEPAQAKSAEASMAPMASSIV